MTNNTLKTLRNGALLSALAVSAVVSTNVKADEVSPSIPENKEKVETTTAIPTTSKDLKPAVDEAKSNSQSAQEIYNKAAAAQSAQESIVAKATGNANESNIALTTANENLRVAEEVVNTTTPEVIANQEKQIENDKIVISEKESDLNKANNKVTAATAEESKQQAVVNAADSNVNAANQATVQAQNEVNKAKSNLEGDDKGKLITEVNKLKAAISSNQQEVTNATTALEVSKRDEATAKSNIDKQIATLETALKNAGSPEIVETKNTVIGSASFDYSYTDGEFAQPGQVLHEQVQYADGVLKKEITKQDVVRNWDVNKLAQNIADYINEVRKLNGINKPVKITANAMRFSADRAKEMDNGSVGHRTNLNPINYGYSAYDEGIEYGFLTDLYGKYTLPEEEAAYNIVHGLFSDYNNLSGSGYGHRESLLLSGTDIGVGVSYSGGSANVILNYLGERSDLKFHSSNNGAFTVTNNDSDPTKSEHWYKGKRLVFLPKAQMDYVTTENITKANPAYSNAKKALEDYKASSATELANKAKIVVANQAKLNSAQTQLANNQTALKQAEAQLGALNASVQDKAKALADAEVKLNQAKTTLKNAEEKRNQELAKLTQAKAVTEQAKSEVETAQKALEAAKAKLSDDQNKLEQLKNAEANLKKAKEELAKAETTQKQAKSILDAEQAKLEELAKATALAKSKLDEAQSQFDKVNKEYTTLLQLENAHQPTNPVNPRVTPSVAPLATTTQNAANAIPVTNKVATSKKLPNTGSETSPLALVGVALIGLLGLAKVRKTSK